MNHPYIQTSEKSSFGLIKNSCLRCGKSKEWHEAQAAEIIRASYEIAEEWLKLHGYDKSSFYELGKSLLTKYVEETRI